MKGSDRGREIEEGKIKDPDQEIEGTNDLVDKTLQDNSSIFSSPEPQAHLGYWYANGLASKWHRLYTFAKTYNL